MKAHATGGAAASRLSPHPAPHIETHRLEDTGNFPNSHLPAIIYRQIFDFSTRVRQSGWKRFLKAMVGVAHGATAFIRTTIITAPRTRCWWS
jgi:hypothetical protein